MLMWLSFANPETGKFHGVVITEANGLLDAAKVAHRLGINPGGEILGLGIPERALQYIQEKDKNRILSKEEAHILAIYLDKMAVNSEMVAI